MAVWRRPSAVLLDSPDTSSEYESSDSVPSTPLPRPDCILLLKDGSMQPAYRGLIEAWLKDASIITERYTLPVYEMPHSTEAVQIWLAMQENALDRECDTPTIEALLDLARLCTTTDEALEARGQIREWLGQHLEHTSENLTADILEVALLCGHRSDVVDACRALVIGRVSNAEVERADELLGVVPPPIRIADMRAKLRETIQLYTMNAFEDHPFYRVTGPEGHVCPVKAMELALYARALHKASCFPFPEDATKVSIKSVLALFAKEGTHTVRVQTCNDCNYVCRGRQLGLLPIIARTVSGMCKTYIRDFERYIAHLPEV
ncbi:hypothetical protein LTR78_009342 [Recurvomyces mirabilis]|uniref:Uncharacterized protein n=1 Tax=Recurvomyces mirabilis TaxID=574656 RepID=A0AAE0TNH1_9PEZI|nr:hypothetical protein LTR78_009342 [Recurvomyces mirabilis]